MERKGHGAGTEDTESGEDQYPRPNPPQDLGIEFELLEAHGLLDRVRQARRHSVQLRRQGQHQSRGEHQIEGGRDENSPGEAAPDPRCIPHGLDPPFHETSRHSRRWAGGEISVQKSSSREDTAIIAWHIGES